MKFSSAKRRLVRSTELIEAVAAEVRDFESKMVERMDDRATGYHRWIACIPEGRLEDVALLFGEAVHGLRTTLDHLMFDMAGRPAGRVPAFPVVVDEPEFEALVSSSLSGIAPGYIDVIRDAQPFRSPQTPLPLLRKLDNIDKHRRLVLASVLQTSNNATLVYGKPYEFNWTLVQGLVPDRLELGSVPMQGLPLPVGDLGISFGMTLVIADPELKDLIPAGAYLAPDQTP